MYIRWHQVRYSLKNFVVTFKSLANLSEREKHYTSIKLINYWNWLWFQCKNRVSLGIFLECAVDADFKVWKRAAPPAERKKEDRRRSYDNMLIYRGPLRLQPNIFPPGKTRAYSFNIYVSYDLFELDTHQITPVVLHLFQNSIQLSNPCLTTNGMSGNGIPQFLQVRQVVKQQVLQ